MRRFTKICLIAGGICVLAGGVITTTAAAMGASFGDTSYSGYRTLGWNLANGIRREIMDDVRDSIADSFQSGWMNHRDYDDYYDGYYDDDYDDFYDDYDNYDYADGSDSEGWTGDDFPFVIDKFSVPDSTAASRKTFSADAVKKISFEIGYGRVYMKEDSGVKEITVSSNASEGDYSCYRDGDELKIDVTALSGPNESDYPIVDIYVQVPSGTRFQEVEADVKSKMKNNGNLRESRGPAFRADHIVTDEMEIDVNVGAAEILKAETGKLDISCDVGAIHYQGSTSRDIDVDSNVGAVELEITGDKKDYNYQVKSSVGVIEIGGSSYAGLSSTKKISNGASKKMELESSVGGISVKFR